LRAWLDGRVPARLPHAGRVRRARARSVTRPSAETPSRQASCHGATRRIAGRGRATCGAVCRAPHKHRPIPRSAIRRPAYRRCSAPPPRARRMAPRHAACTQALSFWGGAKRPPHAPLRSAARRASRGAPAVPPAPAAACERRGTAGAAPCPPRDQPAAPAKTWRKSARARAQRAGPCAHGGARPADGAGTPAGAVLRPRPSLAQIGAQGGAALAGRGRAPPQARTPDTTTALGQWGCAPKDTATHRRTKHAGGRTPRRPPRAEDPTAAQTHTKHAGGIPPRQPPRAEGPGPRRSSAPQARLRGAAPRAAA
jgi:hypothetical protein